MYDEKKIRKVIDFTDINVYPKRYWFNHKNGDRILVIRSLMIEDVHRQSPDLMELDIECGDLIKVDFVFGHNESKTDVEDWIDIRVSGIFKIMKIIPWEETCEIELSIKEI